MTYSIHLTQDWPFEKIARYGPQITGAMQKIEARFPDDVSLEQIARNLAEGSQQLWLILDENEDFAAFVTTEIEITRSGRKRILLLELAGDGGPDLAGMIRPIEDWARETGAQEICPLGRIGWRKALAKHGYHPAILRYRKEL